MRPEKKYLVNEVDNHLKKSEYFILADFERVTVKDVAELRSSLRPQGAEFHVVKNNIFDVAATARGLPSVKEQLKGHTSIIFGGKNPSEVAKILLKFRKDKDRLVVKCGIFGDKKLSSADIETLSKLPSLDVLRSQFLSLLNTPATQFVRICQAVPQGVLNVLQAKSQQE
jgi:large subunit ribosomal protein L10